MVRSCISVALASFVFIATAAEAQLPPFTGVLTGQIGAAASGDVRDLTVMPGVSMAVIDENGLGVEIDASHGGDFDSDRFVDSSITTVMLNFVFMYPHQTFRPFFTAGVGLTRVRVALVPEQASIGQTDTAWSTGGGVLYMLNEAFGFRGDVRYFRNFGRQNAISFGDNGTLNFVRASIGATFSWSIR